MNKTTHHVRKHFTDNGNMTHAAVSLPDIPGVIVTTDRADTTPRQPAIRTDKPSRGAVVGAAARQQALARVAMFRAALIEAMEGRA